MCGISGYFSPSKKITGKELEGMSACLAHRGPDASGLYLNEQGTLGLAHRRLSIIDLSAAANQPMFSHDGRYVTIFNGEIFNFQQVAAQLKISQRTHSDTEIILEAFAQQGPGFIHLLNGMFAIAIYDITEQKLYLFRDRLGVKPLYYFFDGETLAFASEIKALIKSDFINQNISLNKKVIYTFLYAGYIPGPFTVYDKIYRLPSGSHATVSHKRLEIKNYWTPEEKITPQVTGDFNAAKKELKELLTSSVRYRMISDVPFGTFLSGGIDSSMVTALAQSISSQPVNTFSIGFKDAKFNESEYAAKVSKHLGTNHHEFIVTEEDALGLIDRMMNAYDEPYADSSSIPTMLVSKLARQHVTMTLSGDGGDELFLGYGAYNWAKRLNHPLVKALHGLASATFPLLDNRYKRAATVFDYKSKAHLKSHIFSQEQYFFSENELAWLLKPEYQSDPLFDETFHVKRNLSAQEEQALFDIKYYLKDDLLVKVDVASMQFSLETRTPFLDYRVVEFALNLSENWKKKDGVTKYILKELLYEYVPKEFFDRPKWGFSVPMARWLKNDLNYLAKEYLSEEVVTEVNIVKDGEVQELLHRFYKGEDFLYNRLWVLLLLHKWMKEHGKR